MESDYTGSPLYAERRYSDGISKQDYPRSLDVGSVVTRRLLNPRFLNGPRSTLPRLTFGDPCGEGVGRTQSVECGALHKWLFLLNEVG